MILSIFIIILEMIRKQKNVVKMKHFHESTCLILFNVENTIPTVTSMDDTTALQLSTGVGNGLIHGC